MASDYYSTLGVSKGASHDEIKGAFRKKAQEHHPDKGGDAAKFKEINAAYQVLSDAGKRAQYDQYGQTFDQAGGAGGGFGGFGGAGGFGGINVEDLGDIFGNFFGGGQRRGSKSRARDGADIEADLRIAFREAVFGIERAIELWKTVTCRSCSGSGGEPGSNPKTCSTCSGSGQVRQVQRTFLGNMATAVTCTTCNGEGKKWEKKCDTCRGGGVVKERARVDVRVPAGIADGQTLRVTGAGEAGQFGGGAGDLYLTVRVEEDPDMTREGDDIHTTATLPFSRVALGTTIDVETVDGKTSLKVPPATQSGQLFRIRGKGVPKLKGSGRGDHLVHVQVETPKSVSRKQRKLLEELQGEGL